MKKLTRYEATLAKDHHRENFTLGMYERGLRSEIVCFLGKVIVFDTFAALKDVLDVIAAIPGEAGASVRRI